MVEEGVGEEDQRPSTGASVGRLRGVWTKRLRWGVRMSRCRCAAVDKSTGEADPAPWTRPTLNGLWYSGG